MSTTFLRNQLLTGRESVNPQAFAAAHPHYGPKDLEERAATEIKEWPMQLAKDKIGAVTTMHYGPNRDRPAARIALGLLPQPHAPATSTIQSALTDQAAAKPHTE